LEPQISQISQIKNNYSHFWVFEKPFRKDFPGCYLKKSWNENKVLHQGNTDYKKKQKKSV
jgi:hypothetical protein